MTKQVRRRFSPGYKEQAVARLLEPGATYASVAAELDTRIYPALLLDERCGLLIGIAVPGVVIFGAASPWWLGGSAVGPGDPDEVIPGPCGAHGGAV